MLVLETVKRLVCDESGSKCHGAPARATMSTRCKGARACEQVGAIVSTACFASKPWPRMRCQSACCLRSTSVPG